MPKTFSLEKVQQHNNDEDGHWIIIHDKVYDCTRYLPKHPGGGQLITEFSGRDVTLEFKGEGEGAHEHSAIARMNLQKFFIGYLDPSQVKYPPAATTKNKQRKLSKLKDNFFSGDGKVNDSLEKALNSSFSAFLGGGGHKSFNDIASFEINKTNHDLEHDDSDIYLFHFRRGLRKHVLISKYSSMLKENLQQEQSSFLPSLSSYSSSFVNSTTNNAERIVLLYRLFPHVTGELSIFEDNMAPTLLTDSTIQKANFCLSSGYLRKITNKKIDPKNNFLSHEQPQEGSSVQTFESRIILESLVIPQKHNVITFRSDKFDCCDWTLKCEENPEMHQHWITAINSTFKIKHSPEYNDVVLLMHSVVSELSNEIQLFTLNYQHAEEDINESKSTVFPGCFFAIQLIECIEVRFDLSESVAIELANALLNSGFLIAIGNQSGDTDYLFQSSPQGFLLVFQINIDLISIDDKTDVPFDMKFRKSIERNVEMRANETNFDLYQDFAEKSLQKQIVDQQDISLQAYSQFIRATSSCTIIPCSRRRNSTSFTSKKAMMKEFDNYHLTQIQSEEPNKKPVYKIKHTFPCYFSSSVIPQHKDIWPQSPLLLRATPDSQTHVTSIRYVSSTADNQMFLPGSGFCCGCTLPINTGHESKRKCLVVDFNSSLFDGTLLVRIKSENLSSLVIHPRNQKSFFDKQDSLAKRTYQVVIKGRFLKDNIRITDCYTGHTFHAADGKEFSSSPSWFIRSGIKLLSMKHPNLKCQFKDSDFSFLFPLASSAQSIQTIERPSTNKNDPQYVYAETKIFDSITETSDSRSLVTEVFGGSFFEDFIDMDHKDNSPEACRKRRMAVFDALVAGSCAESKKKIDTKDICFKTDREYVFEFYQNIINFDDFSLDLGSSVGRFKLSDILNGRPLKIMATYTPDAASAKPEYLWSFDVWHSTLFDAANK